MKSENCLLPCRQSLTFLDDRKYKRIGGLEDIELDVRVIAATNRNLEGRLRKGQFREDLFYPPQCDADCNSSAPGACAEDIPALCDYYLDYYKKSFAKKNIERVEPDFMRELILYDWKGNVRELKNIFERCFLFSRGNVLEKHVN